MCEGSLLQAIAPAHVGESDREKTERCENENHVLHEWFTILNFLR